MRSYYRGLRRYEWWWRILSLFSQATIFRLRSLWAVLGQIWDSIEFSINLAAVLINGLFNVLIVPTVAIVLILIALWQLVKVIIDLIW